MYVHLYMEWSNNERNEWHRWGELDSGETTIAFTPMHQHETDDLTGEVHAPRSRRERQPVELCFVYDDVDAAYKVHNDDTIIT